MAVERQCVMAGQWCVGWGWGETTLFLSNSIYVCLSEEDKGDFEAVSQEKEETALVAQFLYQKQNAEVLCCTPQRHLSRRNCIHIITVLYY